MLSRRLNGALLVTLATTIVVGCGDKPIEDNLVRPGITAMDDARGEACGMNAATVRTAVDAYTMLEGDPPPDEQALVDEGFLRETTSDWDVVDGELVAENPACGSVGETATPPTVVDIVTEPATESITVDDLLASMSQDQIDQVGGPECARELAEIFAAADRFAAETGENPSDFGDLVDGGQLAALPELWAADGDDLRPVEGSGCLEPG